MEQRRASLCELLVQSLACETETRRVGGSEEFEDLAVKFSREVLELGGSSGL